MTTRGGCNICWPPPTASGRHPATPAWRDLPSAALPVGYAATSLPERSRDSPPGARMGGRARTRRPYQGGNGAGCRTRPRGDGPVAAGDLPAEALVLLDDPLSPAKTLAADAALLADALVAGNQVRAFISGCGERRSVAAACRCADGDRGAPRPYRSRRDPAGTGQLRHQWRDWPGVTNGLPPPSRSS